MPVGTAKDFEREMTGGLSTRNAMGLLALVVFAWGTNWPVTKLIVHDMTPIWATAIRCMIAAASLAPLLWAQGDFIIPKHRIGFNRGYISGVSVRRLDRHGLSLHSPHCG